MGAGKMVLFDVEHQNGESETKRECFCLNDIFHYEQSEFQFGLEQKLKEHQSLFGDWFFLYEIWKQCGEECVGFFQDGFYLKQINDKEKDQVSDEAGTERRTSFSISQYYSDMSGLTANGLQCICKAEKLKKGNVRKLLSDKLFDKTCLDQCMDAVSQMASDYYICGLEYLLKKEYYQPSFVLTHDCFDALCSFVFPVLFRLENAIDISRYPANKLNVLHVLGDFLYGLFVIKNKATKKYTFTEYVLTEEPLSAGASKDFLPAFQENNIPIILSSSDFFSPYLCVCIQSIIEHTSEGNNYDIIVFERDIAEYNKKRILDLQTGRKNVAVRFFNIRRGMAGLNFFINSGRISQETYYGLLIPWFLPLYQKAIIMDCDMIVKQDLSELYSEDLEDCIAGGVRDVILQGWLNDSENDTAGYYMNVVHAKNPYTYVNGGLLLLDFEKYRHTISQELVLHYINNYHFRVVDQDIFNLLLENRMKSLDPKWNHMVYVDGAISAAISNAPATAQNAYFNAKKAPGIIHYASENKPWCNPDLEFAAEFWSCAKRTPFYETILLRMLTPAEVSVEEDHRSGIRKIADVLFPKGTRRREVLKFFLPKGSFRWRFCKQIYFLICPQYRPSKAPIDG